MYGWSEFSPITYILAADTPSTPPKPSFVSATDNSISIQLYPTADNGGSIVESYELEMDQGETSSAFAAIAAMVFTAPSGNEPLAVSPESITASVPSNTALATSVISARVGSGFWIIDSKQNIYTPSQRKIRFRRNWPLF